MNQYQFKGSLSGVYFNRSRIGKIETPEDLLTDYTRRKKNQGKYIDFLKENRDLCLEMANHLLNVRLGRNRKIIKKYPTIPDESGIWYNERGWKVKNNPDGGFEVWIQ